MEPTPLSVFICHDYWVIHVLIQKCFPYEFPFCVTQLISLLNIPSYTEKLYVPIRPPLWLTNSGLDSFTQIHVLWTQDVWEQKYVVLILEVYCINMASFEVFFVYSCFSCFSTFRWDPHILPDLLYCPGRILCCFAFSILLHNRLEWTET